MIQLMNVTKHFEKQEAVKDVTLSVKKGTIYGLLGSNGAGKTTLLKMLAGIYRPSTGSVLVKEQAVFENTTIKENMIYIPDTIYFLPLATVEQMASYYQNIYPTWNEERYRSLESVFSITRKQKVHRLSKGMQRQVAFWLALSCMPELLILDEPIDGLDPVMRQKIKNLLFQDVAEREMTIIISSHNLREIEDLCDHVGIMHKGQLLIEKEIDELKADTHKIQVAFRHKDHRTKILANCSVLHQEQRGSVSLFIIRGEADAISAAFTALDPLVFDLLPLTLEEIFIYEMGDHGYEINNILL
ncbi:ABC transporter ATP-binding protein [Bacillus sp. 2205SS5-2]|uniref:ABC transporter ATP-binding protein n=1 Tax=Bacillus sp. 2205SS5-2 TaxID=3109031 RepID=UPI0030078252